MQWHDKFKSLPTTGALLCCLIFNNSSCLQNQDKTNYSNDQLEPFLAAGLASEFKLSLIVLLLKVILGKRHKYMLIWTYEVAIRIYINEGKKSLDYTQMTRYLSLSAPPFIYRQLYFLFLTYKQAHFRVGISP